MTDTLKTVKVDLDATPFTEAMNKAMDNISRDMLKSIELSLFSGMHTSPPYSSSLVVSPKGLLADGNASTYSLHVHEYGHHIHIQPPEMELERRQARALKNREAYQRRKARKAAKAAAALPQRAISLRGL